MATSRRNAWKIVWLNQRQFWFCLLHRADPICSMDGFTAMVGARTRNGSIKVFGRVDLTDHWELSP